jgi:site-specific DNA recombinase
MTGARRESSIDEDRARAALLPTSEIEMRSAEDMSDPAAVLYLRVSTKEQAEMGGEAEGFSIPAQRDAGRRKAETLGATVVAEFVDRGESARSANRPELQLLLEYVKANRVEYVIVHKVDRLARNRADDVEINLALQAAGVRLVSVTENIDETPSGMLLHGIMSSIAEFYSRNLANEVIKGSTEKAKSGGTVGRAPIGYVNVRRIVNGREARTVELDPERAPLMAWALEQYATGEWTLRGLLQAATERGLTSRGTVRSPSQPLALSHFNRLLKSPYYAGVVTYRGVSYQGTHPRLISMETFDRVQAVLESHGRTGEKQRNHPHYLKTTLRCGSCGSRLIVSHNTGRRGKTYSYFICIGRHQKRTDCTRPAMPIDVVEELVAAYYQTVQLSPERCAEIRDCIRTGLGRRRTTANWELQHQQKRRVQLEKERQKLLQAHYADAIPLDLMKAEQQRITTEVANVEQRIAACETKYDEIENNLAVALDLVSNCARAYALAPPQLRRRFNQAFFEALFIDEDGTMRCELAEPFAALLSDDLAREIEAETQLEATNDKARSPWREAGFWDLNGANTRRVGGVKAIRLVGAEGLEPPTSCL